MKLNKNIQEALAKIGSVTMTTLDRGAGGKVTMHSRIISICGSDDQGIYFLTMNVKPFYRQLKANSDVALCGIYPSSRKTGKNAVNQPSFAPGFTLRITGQAREIPGEETKRKADAGDEIHQYFLEACTFKAIVPGDPYRVDGSRCDECGSCFLVCPQDALVLSRTI